MHGQCAGRPDAPASCGSAAPATRAYRCKADSGQPRAAAHSSRDRLGGAPSTSSKAESQAARFPRLGGRPRGRALPPVAGGRPRGRAAPPTADGRLLRRELAADGPSRAPHVGTGLVLALAPPSLRAAGSPAPAPPSPVRGGRGPEYLGRMTVSYMQAHHALRTHIAGAVGMCPPRRGANAGARPACRRYIATWHERYVKRSDTAPAARGRSVVIKYPRPTENGINHTRTHWPL